MPTDQNPADFGSHRGSVTDADFWWNGPKWLQDRNTWPPNPVTTASEVPEAESKIVQEVLAALTTRNKMNLINFSKDMICKKSYEYVPG